jgi:outer membrane protein assembly factor BamB
MGKKRRFAVVLSALATVVLTGCTKPRAPAPEAPRLDERGLRVYWRATLPLEGGEQVVSCRLLMDNVYCITNHAVAFALYADAGAIAWSRPLGSRGDMVFEPTVSLGSGLDDAVVLTSQEGVWLTNRHNGGLIGHYRLPYAPGGAAVASDELIWCGDVQGVMHATLPSADYDLWRVQTGGAITATPLLLPDRIIFCSNDGRAYCSEPVTKKLLWIFEADGAITASPAHNDTMLFVPSLDRHLYCLSIDTGELIWQYLAPEPLAHRPYATGDTVYLLLGESGLVALDLSTGRQLWQYEDGRDFVSQDGDKVYLVDFGGDLVAVKRNGGAELWRIPYPGTELVAANEKDAAMYLMSHAGVVTCLRRLDMPFLRPSDMEAALRSGRGEKEAAGE